MSCCGINNTLLGGNNNVIKYYGSDLIAVEGPNTVAKVPLGEIRIPYKQVITSRIILKPGQTNYLLNFLGLGDNANLLMVAATFDPKSKIETDNFVQYNYFDDFSKMYTFANVLTLSGNSTNRVKQIYLHNPNTKYPVTLNVMAAVIDETYSFFNAVSGQDMAFSGLSYTDIITWVPNESIAILNPTQIPIAYIQLQNINSIEKSGKILIIDDQAIGFIYLDFTDEYNASQAQSLINWAMEGADRVIQDLDPRADSLDPIIYWTSNVTLPGATVAGPYNTSQGDLFSAGTMSVFSYGGAINKSNIIDFLITNVIDNRDGLMSMTHSNINITDVMNNTANFIVSPGTYSITFNITDIAMNVVDLTEEVILTVGS